MRLERHIRRVFDLEKVRQPAPESLSPEQEGTLAHLGYPTLQQGDFFLGLPALERWRTERALVFPPGCCVCFKEVSRYLPARADGGWFGLRGGERIVERVPHCEHHGSGDEARLIVSVQCWSELVCHVSLIGLNKPFLAEVAKLSQAGEVPPPWRAFPTYSPASSGWRQGNGESWMGRAWRPFWTSLPEAERADYLNRWAAPAEWREWLA